jgi:hypothetical protein
MNYKKNFNQIPLLLTIISLSLVPMIMYQYTSLINILPAIEVCIAYFLYHNRFNLWIIYIYLFFIDILYSYLFLSSVICFYLSCKAITLFEQKKHNIFLEKLIQISIYTSFFLIFRYIIFCLYEKNFYNFFDCFIQILNSILIYSIIDYIFNLKKLRYKDG